MRPKGSNFLKTERRIIMAMYENSMALDEEIERVTKVLKKLDPVTDDYETVRKNLDSLYKLREAQYETDTTSNTAAEKLEAEKQKQEDEVDLEKQKLELEKQKLEDATARSEAELEQRESELEFKKQELDREMNLRSRELEFKKQELELAERKRQDEAARVEAEQKQREAEAEIRKQELALATTQHTDLMADKKKDRIRDYATTGVQLAVSALKLAAVIGVSLLMTDQGYKFEENGVPTSPTFREARKNIADLIKDTFKK
jgi:hypothetical protein